MIKLSKKSLLLFVSAIAMAAFALPSMASASTFDGIGRHTLTSNNLSFTSAGLGGGSICSSSTFELDVVSATHATVTGASFTGCNGIDGLAGVPATVTATNFPWRVTPVGDGFTIDGIHIVAHFPAAALDVTLAGNLPGAIDNASHTITLNGATGLTATAIPGGSAPATVSGDLRDDQGTLTVTT